MTERPILMSGPMVQAILAGRKTQTRRVVKPQPIIHPAAVGRAESIEWHGRGVTGAGYCHTSREAFERLAEKVCPYGKPGDRLWVRESYCPYYFDGGKHGYRADWNARAMKGFAPEPRWTPSIHMRRAHSRLTLEINEVRVQRLQDISEEDALAEGASPAFQDCDHARRACREIGCSGQSFNRLWDSIHSEGAWDANPWVWAVSFKRVDKEASDGR